VRIGGERIRHSTVVASLLAVFIGCTAIILITVESDSLTERDLDVPLGREHISLLQQPAMRHMEAQGSLRGAIAQLSASDKTSGARIQQLYHQPWLNEIFGKDTTYDTKYITSLKPGDVSVAGYDGLPVAKGILPSAKDLNLADKMLNGAINDGTMPEVDNLWDGQPYVPTQEFKDSLSKAWAGFHQAIGEKRWEKKIHVDCHADPMGAGCAEALGGKHEGYNTTWDGEKWSQFDGEAWNDLKTDDKYGYKV